MTRAELDAAKKRLAEYLRRLRFVHSYGGCVLDPRDRPVHRGKSKVRR